MKKRNDKQKKFYSYILTHKQEDFGNCPWKDQSWMLHEGFWDDMDDIPALRKAAYLIAVERGFDKNSLHHTYARGLYSLDDNKNHVKFIIRQEEGLAFVLCDARLGYLECRTGTEKAYTIDDKGQLHEETV